MFWNATMQPVLSCNGSEGNSAVRNSGKLQWNNDLIESIQVNISLVLIGFISKATPKNQYKYPTNSHLIIDRVPVSSSQNREGNWRSGNSGTRHICQRGGGSEAAEGSGEDTWGHHQSRLAQTFCFLLPPHPKPPRPSAKRLVASDYHALSSLGECVCNQ